MVAHVGSLLINTAGLLSNGYAFFHVTNSFPADIGFGGVYQFLTIIGLTAATITFALRFLRFFVPTALEVPYKTVAYISPPLEALISLLYWPLALYNAELLAHQEIPFVLPLALDLSLHLWPAVLLWADFLLFDTKFKKSRNDIITIYLFCVAYFVWSTYCFYRNGFWVYPFLAEFNTPARAIFYFICGSLCAIIYNGGARIHASIHKVKQSKTE